MSFYAPCPGTEAVILLLKELLQSSYVKEKYKERVKKLRNIDPQGFVDAIAERFRKRYAQTLLAKAQTGDWDGILKLRRKLLKTLVLMGWEKPLWPAHCLRNYIGLFRDISFSGLGLVYSLS